MPKNTLLKRIRVDFSVTKEIKRYVCLYIIVSNGIHIIDTGVSGAEAIIEDYLKSIGRNIFEVRNILLTHSHPDHIGSAFAIKELSDCTVYAPEKEISWIENIDKQFAQRPIPSFYTLLNKSVSVDKPLKDNDTLILDDGVTIKVIDTKGHSGGSISFLWVEQGELFTGDAIPVPGDMPIYVSAGDSMETLKRLLVLGGVRRYLPAWDNTYDNESGKIKIKESLEFLLLIDKTVKTVLENSDKKDMDKIYSQVCTSLNLNHLFQNPLFKASIYSNIKENQAIVYGN